MEIFINVELSTQVPVLLLAQDQHAGEWVRKEEGEGRERERERERREEREERERERCMGGRMVSYSELSAVIILQCHLRHPAPHPAPPLTVPMVTPQCQDLIGC